MSRATRLKRLSKKGVGIATDVAMSLLLGSKKERFFVRRGDRRMAHVILLPRDALDPADPNQRRQRQRERHGPGIQRDRPTGTLLGFMRERPGFVGNDFGLSMCHILPFLLKKIARWFWGERAGFR